MGLGLGTGFGAGGAFNPLALSPSWMVDAAIGFTPSQWDDQGSSGKHLLQGTGSKQGAQALIDAAYNNQATISFASASLQCMQSAAFAAAIPQPYTIWLIGNTGGSGSQALFDGRDGTNRCEVYTSATLPRAYAGLFLNAVSPGSSKNIIIVEANGASSKIWISARTPDVTSDAGANALGGVTIGAAFDLTSDPLNGKIAQAGIVARALTTAERNQLLTYAGNRYAISIGA